MKLGVLAAPLAVLAAVSALAVPSSASTGRAKAAADCPARSLCVWTKANFEGDRLVIDDPGPSNKIFRKMNDRISSARLRHPGYAVLYEDVDQQGSMLCLLDAPGVRKYPDLSQVGGSYDNIISSSDLSEEPIETCF